MASVLTGYVLTSMERELADCSLQAGRAESAGYFLPEQMA
jgi:hypothetical protein